MLRHGRSAGSRAPPIRVSHHLIAPFLTYWISALRGCSVNGTLPHRLEQEGAGADRYRPRGEASWGSACFRIGMDQITRAQDAAIATLDP